MVAKRPRTYSQARAKVARLRGQLNALETAAASPRCLVRWTTNGEGDTMVAWVMDGCEGEQSLNVTDLRSEMKCLYDEFGPAVLKSRKGKALNLELPTLTKGVA